MTIQLRRALFALALGFSLPLPAKQIWAAPAQIAPETATLRAVVSDAAGKPIEGAAVVVVRNDDDKEQTITLKTDAQGRFETQLPKSKFIVEAFVHAPGSALQRVYLKLEGDNEITLKPGVAATGKVVDAQGKPVADARVEVTRLFLSADDEEMPMLRSVSLEALRSSALKGALQTQTDANGVWKFENLPAGAVGYFELNDPRFARDLQFGLPNATRQIAPDLTAKPGATLKGRVVTPDGKPVAKAIITAIVGEGRGSYSSTQTASDGSYLLTSLPAGAAKIQVSSPNPNLAPTSIQGVTVEASKTTTAPEVRLSAGVLLSGKVTDKESKAPLAGARVNAMGDFGNAFSAATGKDGVYSVRVPTGQVRFYVYSRPVEYVRDMFADAKTNITQTSTNAPDFAIVRGLTLTGTARDETGAPAQGALVTAGSSFDGAQTVVDADGTWTLQGVDPKTNGRPNPRGKVQLTTTGDWQIVGDGLFSRREGTEIALTLRRIERRDVTLRVVTPTGEPVADAQVRVAILFDAKSGATRYENALTNERGEITVKRLRPDESAEITPTKEGYALQKAGVITVLAGDAARTTDAVLTPKNGSLRGRVVDAAGVAAVGARIAVLWPGDLREAKSVVLSDANGRFELDNLRAGELLIGAARGRDWGQVKAQTGGDIEIKLARPASQPAPGNRAGARQVLEQWFADSKKQENATLTNYAARIAALDSPDTEKLIAQSEDGKLWFEQEQTPERIKAQQDRALQAARAAVDEPKKVEEHQRALIGLATLLVERGDLKGAREIYDSVAPNVIIPRVADPKQALWDAYKYAQLAAIAGAIGHPGADYWIEILDRSLDQMSADDRLFRIGGTAETLAKTDVAGALQWLDTRSPAEQVRSYENVIPVVARRDLPRAQELLAKMEGLVARGDIPIEPDRNDAMYRPTPARSLNVARTAIIHALLPTNPRAAYEQAAKLTADNYLSPNLQIAAALRLPAAEALPILRAQFALAQDKDNRSVAAMAKLAKLVAPFDAELSEQWFEMARQRLADDKSWNDDTREMAAPYAFYRADSDPAGSRLLLENEWQRTIPTKSDNQYARAARLRYIVWAMVPLDWERALQMMRETNELLGEQYLDGMITQRNLAAWLLSSEQERREMDFEGATIKF